MIVKNQNAFAPGSLKIAYNGIRFFYSHTVVRDWEMLRNLRVAKQRKLPAVLSIAEVRQRIAGSPASPSCTSAIASC